MPKHIGAISDLSPFICYIPHSLSPGSPMHSSFAVLLAIFPITVGSLRSHAAGSAGMDVADSAALQPEPPKDDAPEDKAVPRLLAPQNAVLALKRWHDAALCSSCKGVGKITKKETTSTTIVKPDGPGSAIRQQNTTDVLAECPTCSGEKLTKEPRLVAAARTFAKTLAQVDITSERWPDAHDDLLINLRKLVDLGKTAWKSRLNQSIGVLLTGTVQKTAQPIVFVGFLDQDRQKNETEDRVLWISVGNTSVRFEKPRLVDSTGLGQVVPLTVLCGGWLTSREDDNGRFVSVIENGFVMSIR